VLRHSYVGYDSINDRIILRKSVSLVCHLFELLSRTQRTRTLAKQTKAERCFGNQLLAITFHIFVKLVAPTHSFMRCYRDSQDVLTALVRCVYDHIKTASPRLQNIPRISVRDLTFRRLHFHLSHVRLLPCICVTSLCNCDI